MDILNKARAEDPNEDCYLGAFIECGDKLWAVDEYEDEGFKVDV